MRPRTETRPVLVYLAAAFGIALAIALALPRMGLATLLSALTPVIAVAVTITATSAPGTRRAAWRAIGWRRPSAGPLLFAVLVPMTVAAASFGFARVVGVARFPDVAPSLAGTANLVVTLVLGSALFLGEEIGWRGFLYPRLTTLMPRRRAAVLTGVTHAAFHLPLLLLTTTYQTAGNRLIVVPTVMVTIAAGGVVYAWLRDRNGSIWAVSVMHNAFNTFMELGARLAVPTSAAALAYTTTETGVATMVLVLTLAAGLLTRPWPRDPARGDGSSQLPCPPQTHAPTSGSDLHEVVPLRD